MYSKKPSFSEMSCLLKVGEILLFEDPDLDRKMNLSINLYTGSVISLAEEAGKKILSDYNQGFDIYEKADKSPLTDADLLSHKTIIEGLAQITSGIPVISEQSSKDEISSRLS